MILPPGGLDLLCLKKVRVNLTNTLQNNFAKNHERAKFFSKKQPLLTRLLAHQYDALLASSAKRGYDKDV